MKKYYEEIDKTLYALENGMYPLHDIDWVCNRIDWCWKWRKISCEEKDSLCERTIKWLEGDIK